MKIFSWNVNGIRAVIRKGDFGSFVEKYDPDILCMQETKAEQGQAARTANERRMETQGALGRKET